MNNPVPNTPSASESAYAQAKKYGEDLAKLYALEKAKRAKLQISNQKLEAIFSTTPDGLAILDQELHIEEANPAFWKLVEQSKPEQPVALPHILPYPTLINQLQTPRSAGQSINKIEIDIQISGMAARSLLFNAVPLAAKDNRGWVLIVHDLTERKRLESLKSEFINIAAHELRTPLAAILGFSQVLQEMLVESNDELSSHMVNTILDSGNRLKGIIDELIEFADIDHQRRSGQNTTSLNLVSLVQEECETIKRFAVEKNLSVKTEAGQTRIDIIGNPNIIREVLRHLLENAITFNKPNGKIIVRVSEQHELATIEVEDTGIGIAQKELDKIFDKFYQVEEHLTRSIGGLGLGLAIAQRGIQLYGGTISVTSQLNRGSCFTVTFPKTTPLTGNKPDEGLKDAYQQTIAYGKDLAKAVAAEKVAELRLKELETVRQELLYAIRNNAPLQDIAAIVKQMAPQN